MIEVFTKGRRKLFVLDTNVILHDSDCIDQFEENDVAIPITVLEEIDRFKRGREDIHVQARRFLRRLDEITGDLLSEGGVPLGDGRGSIRVVVGGTLDPRIQEAFAGDTPDHRILNTALRIKERTRNRRVVLVTKDTNLRLKAKSLGVIAQDYKSDKVETVDAMYKGKRVIDDASPRLIDALYQSPREVMAVEFPLRPPPVPNENFVFRSGSKSALATYRAAEKKFVRVEKQPAYGIQPRNAEQIFALAALLNESIRLVTLTGSAGTGKTLLALAAALECRKNYRQVLLARPVVPLSHQDLGYLPGDIEEKLDPYMQPLYDNLAVIRDQFGDKDAAAQRLNELRETGKLEITPLAYIRGRSLPRIFFIVDEAQNLTPHEVKTIITRAGEGTKIVLTGDIHQIDQPYLDSLSNGLSYLISRMKGQPIYAHVTLEKGERSELADLASDLL
ncbi:MAG: PhoH family protein [Planctomycetes bacterium]|jgi:PhoH-like ATPase|nr:PhoH family protein [Planctomycetota bacterium]